MRKKLLILMVAMFIVSGLISGCSKDKTVNSSPQTTNQGDSKTNNELASIVKSASAVKEMSFDMLSTSTSQGKSVNSQSKLYMSNGRVRMENESMGMKSVVIMNGKGETWMYNPADKMAVKMADFKNKNDLPNKWAKENGDLSGMKIVGYEKKDGYDCVVVTITEAEDTSKMWLRKDIGMPLRVESSNSEGVIVLEYKNYNMGSQADNLFEIPADAKVVEMPSGVPNVSNMPNMPSAPGQ